MSSLNRLHREIEQNNPYDNSFAFTDICQGNEKHQIGCIADLGHGNNQTGRPLGQVKQTQSYPEAAGQ